LGGGERGKEGLIPCPKVRKKEEGGGKEFLSRLREVTEVSKETDNSRVVKARIGVRVKRDGIIVSGVKKPSEGGEEVGKGGGWWKAHV